MRPHKIIQQTIVGILTNLLLSCFIQSVAARGNLVVNGGFDTDTSGWTLTNGAVYQPLFGNPAGSIDLPIANPPSSYGTVSQEISSLTPGQFYTVSGDYYRGGGVKNPPNSFAFGVAFDGSFVLQINAPTSPGWYSFSFNWQATSINTLLSLSAPLNETYDFSIDNIAMYAVPEPNSLCLMGVGGMMSALFFRHRRKARRE
jgi:hypothetical protein